MTAETLRPEPAHLDSDLEADRTNMCSWLPTPERLKSTTCPAQARHSEPRRSAAVRSYQLYGSHRRRFRPAIDYTMASLPEDLRDYKQWHPFEPAVLSKVKEDGESESPFARFMRLYNGLVLLLDGGTLKAAADIAGTTPSEVLRLLRKCVRLDQFGKPWGFAALNKNAHGGEYNRTAPLDPDKGPTGRAGEIRRFLDDHVQVLPKVVAAIHPAEGQRRLSRGSAKVVFNAFVRACNDEGIEWGQFPLDTPDAAKRTVRRITKAYLYDHPESFEYWYGPGARDQLMVGRGGPSFQLAQHPFDLMMCDAHPVDLEGCLVIETPAGPKRVPVKRLWFIAVHGSNSSGDAISGMSWSYESKVSAETIERAFIRARKPWAPRALCANLSYVSGAGLPNGIVPGLEDFPVAALQFDNDTANWAKLIVESLRKALGCHVIFGPVGKFFTNARLERFFETFEAAGIHLMPSTLGTGPQDRRRPKSPGQEAVDHAIDTQLIEDILELFATAENVRQCPTRSDMSPLEIIGNRMTLGANRWIPRPPVPASAFAPLVGWVEEWRRIGGERRIGKAPRRPYIELYGTRYASPDIEHRFDLIGERYLRRVCRADSTVRAYLEDGTEIRNLYPIGRNAPPPMPLSLKAGLHNSRNRSKTCALDLELALDSRIQALAAKAVEDGRRRPKNISKAASELAQIQLVYSQNYLPPPSVAMRVAGAVVAQTVAFREVVTTGIANIARPIAGFTSLNKRTRR